MARFNDSNRRPGDSPVAGSSVGDKMTFFSAYGQRSLDCIGGEPANFLLARERNRLLGGQELSAGPMVDSAALGGPSNMVLQRETANANAGTARCRNAQYQGAGPMTRISVITVCEEQGLLFLRDVYRD